MKIAYLSTFYPYRGGIAQFNALLFRELEKKHVLKAFNFSRQYPAILFPGETQFVKESDSADPIPNTRTLDSVNPLTYLKTIRLIKKFNPDLLLMRFWMPFFAPSLGYVAGKIQKSTKAKIIAILDNVIPHEKRPGDIKLLKYFLKRCDAFIAMSTSVEQELLSLRPGATYQLKPHPVYEHFGKPVEKNKARQKLNLKTDKKILLYFGFIRKYKGLDTLIKTMSLLPDDYRLVIAGEVYGDFKPYQKLIEEQNTGSKIIQFVRYIDDHEVPLFFSAADVCVLPYKSATQSGITQIAFNFNLPVICTDVGGLAEMVRDGETGFVLQSQEPAELAELIQKYFRLNKVKSFSENIAQKRHEFSWAGFAKNIMQLYQKISV